MLVCLFDSSTDPPHAGSNYFGVPPPSYICISRILAGLAITLAVLGGYFTSASVPHLSMSNICLIHVYPVPLPLPLCLIHGVTIRNWFGGFWLISEFRPCKADAFIA